MDRNLFKFADQPFVRNNQLDIPVPNELTYCKIGAKGAGEFDVYFSGIFITSLGYRLEIDKNWFNITFDDKFKKFFISHGPLSFKNKDRFLEFKEDAVVFGAIMFVGDLTPKILQNGPQSKFPIQTKQTWIRLMCDMSKGTKHDQISLFVNSRWAVLRTLYIGKRETTCLLSVLKKDMFNHVLTFLTGAFFLKDKITPSRKRKIDDCK